MNRALAVAPSIAATASQALATKLARTGRWQNVLVRARRSRSRSRRAQSRSPQAPATRPRPRVLVPLRHGPEDSAKVKARAEQEVLGGLRGSARAARRLPALLVAGARAKAALDS
eukprot:2864247-Alexandrium_andersonii.AAC.1